MHVQDKFIIREFVRIAAENGWTLDKDQPDAEDFDFPVNDAENIIKACDDLDEFTVYFVQNQTNYQGWVFFVMGNEPGIIICDASGRLGDIFDKTMESHDQAFAE